MSRRSNNPSTTPTSASSRYGGGGRMFAGGGISRATTFGGERSTSGSNFGFRTMSSAMMNSGGGGESGGKRNLGGAGLSTSRPIGTHLVATGRAVNIKDPRPILDKSYQTNMIQTLIEYLIQNKCPFTVTEKMLRGPSIKEFVQIFELMYCLFDPKFKMKDKDYVKEVPDAFRLLGYPITISKSTMQTISASHSWPLLLAALNWLRELIVAGLNINLDLVLFSPDEDEVVSPTEPDETLRKTIFDYNIQCFVLHMQQGVEDFEKQDQFLADSILRWQNEAGLEQLQNEHDRLLDELKMLESSESEHEVILEECQRLELDVLKMDKYIKEVGDYNQGQMSTNNEKRREIAVLDQEILELRREIERKEALINQQEISPVEVKRMINIKHDLHNKIKSLDTDGERLQKEQFETEKQMHKERGKIDVKMVEFKQKSKSLFSSSSKLGLDRSWIEYLNFDFSPYEPKFTSYFTETLRPGIDLVIQKCNEAVHNTESDVHKLKETIDDLEEEVCALGEEIQNLNEEIKQTETKVQCLKQGKNVDSQRAKQEIDRLKKQYDELCLSKEMSCAEKEKQLESLIKEKNEKSAKFNREIDQWTDYLKKTVQLILSHKEFIQKLEQEKSDRIKALMDKF